MPRSRTLLKQVKRRLKEIVRISESSSIASVSSDHIDNSLAVESKLDSAIASAAAALQVCTILIVQHGPTDAYVFEQVGIFVPAFRKVLDGKMMQKVVMEIVRPRSSFLENARHMIELLSGLGWKQVGR